MFVPTSTMKSDNPWGQWLHCLMSAAPELCHPGYKWSLTGLWSLQSLLSALTLTLGPASLSLSLNTRPHSERPESASASDDRGKRIWETLSGVSMHPLMTFKAWIGTLILRFLFKCSKSFCLNYKGMVPEMEIILIKLYGNAQWQIQLSWYCMGKG